jgi:hypothetical protein
MRVYRRKEEQRYDILVTSDWLVRDWRIRVDFPYTQPHRGMGRTAGVGAPIYIYQAVRLV